MIDNSSVQSIHEVGEKWEKNSVDCMADVKYDVIDIDCEICRNVMYELWAWVWLMITKVCAYIYCTNSK